MTWNDGLTGEAFEIAKTDNSPLRVMAGPGTGKSFAMKRRVARLLESGQDPDRILAVTFTRNAAANLVDDLKGLSIDGCENLHAGTVHSHCFSLLNREHVFEFLHRTPRPLIAFSSRMGTLQFEGGPMVADLVRLKTFGKKRSAVRELSHTKQLGHDCNLTSLVGQLTQLTNNFKMLFCLGCDFIKEC